MSIDNTPFLGLLRLDTRFPRLPGDAGLAASWPMPVRTEVVFGAAPRRVVASAPDPDLLAPFIAAGRHLVAQGAAGLTTSCGFLVVWQDALQATLPVPVWTSSLLALPILVRPGVLTVDARVLGAEHLLAAGADPATPVEGLAPGCHLQRTLLDDLPTLDVDTARADCVAAARRLVGRHPQVETIVLECTNLPPFADDIARATGRPVRHLIDLVMQRWAAAL